MTPILHVVFPEKYGVRNSIAESAMRRLGFWPDFAWGSGFGSKYVAVNDRVVSVARELDVDLCVRGHVKVLAGGQEKSSRW